MWLETARPKTLPATASIITGLAEAMKLVILIRIVASSA